MRSEISALGVKIILFLVRRVLSLRYKVKLKWVENLKHDWPILLLANHVALVDPRILISFLGKYLSISPVASEKYYNKPWIKQVMDLVWTVPIWEMEAWADATKVKEVFSKIVDSLKSGKNILIYPSWQIYRQNFESIKWKQSVYNIVKLMPENTKVVGIRDRWLWGSIWSMAWDNWKSWFWKLYLKSIWYVIANLIFFVPKREVNIEIEDITEQINLYKNMSLWEFNWFLENFYNKSPEEKLNFIKHYFYYNDVKNKKEPEIITWSLKDLQNSKKLDLSQIPEEIKKDIFKKIANIKEIMTSPQPSPQGEREKSISENSNLILDLFFDSLDMAEIKSYIQAKYPQSSNPPITDLKTVWDLLIMAVWKSENREELKPCDWQEFSKKGDLVEKIEF